jgi:hypothetical protein
MAWLEDKLAKWKRLINEHAGAGAADYVLEGNEELAGMTPQERADWSCRAMIWLEEVIPDLETRKKIMVDRSCVFTEEFGEGPLLKLREIYKRTGDLEAVFEVMTDDREKHSRPYLDGETIVEVKAPCDAAAFAAAQTPEERRMASCFCPLAQAGVVTSSLPEPHCYCGGGWYTGIWQVILEKPVQVEVLRSVMRGDDDCAFAIHL